MSDIGSTWGPVIDAIGDEGAAAYLRGYVIAPLIASGYSAAAGLRELRAAGLGFRTQDFYRAWNQVSAQVTAAQESPYLAYDVSAGTITGNNPPANWTGQYVHQVTATFRTREDDGSYLTRSRTLGVKADAALDPLNAAGVAMDILSSPVDAGDEDKYPAVGDLTGLQLTGVYFATSPGATGGLQ